MKTTTTPTKKPIGKTAAEVAKPAAQPTKKPAKTPAPISPEWIDSAGATARFGLGRFVLYTLAKSGRIKTTSIRSRGNTRGKRLYLTASIEALLEANAEGGEC